MAHAINSHLPSQITMPAQPAAMSPGVDAANGPSFKNVPPDSTEQVNSMQQGCQPGSRVVDDRRRRLGGRGADGSTEGGHGAARMAMQIRTKLLAAYEEVKNIRV